jgi:hypothetical protein
VDAELVFQADDPQAVAVAQLAVSVGDELRHHEEADPLGSFRRVRQAGQDQMAHVRGQVTVAPGDEDFLAADRKGPVPVRHRLGPQRADIGPRLRFGQVHRAGPFAGGQLGQVKRLDLVAGVVLQRLDLALGEERFQLQGETGAGHHVVDPECQRDRQAHAAMRRAGCHAYPAAIGNRPVALGKAG